MAISPVLPNLDGVSDVLKEHYVERDGAFHLEMDDTLKTHYGVTPLAKAYQSEKEGRKADKEARVKAEADLEAALKERPDAEALVKLRAELEADRDQWKSKAETLDGQLTGVTRDRALSDALTAAGVTNPAFVKAAQAMLSGSVKMVEGKAIVETDMGPVDVGAHVKRWAAGDEGKAFVTPPAGGGAPGGGGGKGTQPKANMGGSREERTAAIKAKLESQ